jgi:hypothetical protein
MPASRRLARPSPADQPLPFAAGAGSGAELGPGATGGEAHVAEPVLAEESPALRPPDQPPVGPGRPAAGIDRPSPRSGHRPGDPAGGLTAEQRVLRARLAAYHLHATHDPKETTRKARETFLSRFEREVDPAGVLTAGERARRAEAARRAYFTWLALRSSRDRRRTG